MGKSPFARYANASLKLEIATDGDLITDPETGNILPSTEIIEFKALLKSKPSKDDVKLKELAGVDAASTYCEGWLVGRVDAGILQGLETAFFPEGVRVPIEVEALLDGKEGRLQILPSVASPYGVERKTGQKILAYFSHRKGA